MPMVSKVLYWGRQMIEATYKLNEEEQLEVIRFNQKIRIEYSKYKDVWKTLTKGELIKKSIEITFVRLLVKYLREETSLSQIRELMCEENLIEKCHKRFKKELSKGIYKLDYVMEISAILDVVIKNNYWKG